MDQPILPIPIPLKKGLLTKLPIQLVEIYKKNDSSQKFLAGKIIVKEGKDTFINLIATQYATAHYCQDSACNKFFTINNPMFCPTVVKIKKDNTLKNLGTFCCTTHQDVIEACRLKNATFLPYKQGAIYYYPPRDSSYIIPRYTAEDIKKIIDSNLAQTRDEGIDLKIPLIFDTSTTH
jgi:hypothetical protein